MSQVLSRKLKRGLKIEMAEAKGVEGYSKSKSAKASQPIIKSYHCRLCNYSGSRWKVRKHIREVHEKKQAEKNMDGGRLPSNITPLCIAEEIR